MRACRTLPKRISLVRQPATGILQSHLAHKSLSTKPNMSLWVPRSNAPGFSSLFRMLDDFDKYASQAIGRPIGTSMTDGVQTFAPRFDVTEHEKNYSLQGELPGVAPENVTIEFTDPQTLVIRGHTQREHTEGDPTLAQIEEGKQDKKEENGEKNGAPKETGKAGPKYWLSERSYGEFSRVFNFPSGVDQENVEAKFNNGVLNIIVPKMEKKGARKIEITK
ncbi:putative heat shock protein [Echria macrotheca]|uniref:Heat shock protein n=1 Tax=Echria macrotheca TaxID=438768 RepID=A0AAJ0FGD6_9PEZI|nr:putative heat shock protein [Echria macrotheca]